MESTLKSGMSVTRRYEIDAGRTIDFMGDALRVYATPELVRDIEVTCRDMLLEHCAEGEDSVGASVKVDHTAPTLLGGWVEITATVAAVEGPLVTFEIAAKDAVEDVAKGRHVRFVVAKSKLEARLKAKSEKAADA